MAAVTDKSMLSVFSSLLTVTMYSALREAVISIRRRE